MADPTSLLASENQHHGRQVPWRFRDYQVPGWRRFMLYFGNSRMEEAYVRQLNMEAVQYDFWMGVFRMTLMIVLSFRYLWNCLRGKGLLLPWVPKLEAGEEDCPGLWIPFALTSVGAAHAVTTSVLAEWYISHREGYILVDTTLVWIGLAVDAYRRLEPNFTAIVRLAVAFIGFATFRYHSPFYSYLYRGLVGVGLLLSVFMFKGNHELSSFAIPICISFFITVLCYKYEVDKRTRMLFSRRWEASASSSLS